MMSWAIGLLLSALVIMLVAWLVDRGDGGDR